ncbi:MAG TPA: phosphatase PAP2 family protein [Clostridiaceae bacterium]
MTKENILRYKHFLWCTIFILLILWFELLKKTIVPIYIMHTPLDDKIPFIKEFILPYYAWFPYMALALILLGILSKKNYFKLVLYLSLCMSISYIIYMLFPNGQSPRPSVMGQDILSKLVRFLYSIDETNCVCPSIHVANSIAVHMAIINCKELKDKHYIKWASFIVMLLISSSTVFVKQHSILDVYAGILLAFILYVAIYIIPKFFHLKSTTEKLNA